MQLSHYHACILNEKSTDGTAYAWQTSLILCAMQHNSCGMKTSYLFLVYLFRRMLTALEIKYHKTIADSLWDVDFD